MKYSILSRNRECKPRTVKFGNFYLFIDSKVLRKRVNAMVKEMMERPFEYYDQEGVNKIINVVSKLQNIVEVDEVK